MTQEVLDFIIELELAYQERAYLTSKRDMLGAANKDAERFKTTIASLLLGIIEKWYTTVFTEENYCDEETIQKAVDSFNSICNSNVYLNIPLTYSVSISQNFWNDPDIWDDSQTWQD
jgi:hypothetical protein